MIQSICEYFSNTTVVAVDGLLFLLVAIPIVGLTILRRRIIDLSVAIALLERRFTKGY